MRSHLKSGGAVMPETRSRTVAVSTDSVERTLLAFGWKRDRETDLWSHETVPDPVPIEHAFAGTLNALTKDAEKS